MWRPLGGQAVAPAAYAQPAKAKSPWPTILIGCGIALVVVIVLGIVGTFALISSPDFQRSFCNSYTNSDPNLACPFHPSSP